MAKRQKEAKEAEVGAAKTAAKEDEPSKEEGTGDMDEDNLSFEDNKDDNDRGNGPYVDEQPPKKKKKKDKKEKRKHGKKGGRRQNRYRTNAGRPTKRRKFNPHHQG